MDLVLKQIIAMVSVSLKKLLLKRKTRLCKCPNFSIHKEELSILLMLQMNTSNGGLTF